MVDMIVDRESNNVSVTLPMTWLKKHALFPIDRGSVRGYSCLSQIGLDPNKKHPRYHPFITSLTKRCAR